MGVHDEPAPVYHHRPAGFILAALKLGGYCPGATARGFSNTHSGYWGVSPIAGVGVTESSGCGPWAIAPQFESSENETSRAMVINRRRFIVNSHLQVRALSGSNSSIKNR